MKALIYALFIIFAGLMIATFYIANRMYEGLVEDNYYQSAKDYFLKKEEEEIAGFEMRNKKRYVVGRNIFSALLTLKDKPLKNAEVMLFVAHVSTTEYDKFYTLHEKEPGKYETHIQIPFKGQWLFRIHIQSSVFTTERRWFVTVD